MRAAVAAFLLGLGCEARHGGSDGGVVGAHADGEEPGDAPRLGARLSDIERTIFATRCTFSVCHGADVPQQGMSLAGRTYEILVNQASTEFPDRPRIAPGDPERSYLLEKITRPVPSAGKRMPPDQPLEQADIELVRAWIHDGARDN